MWELNLKVALQTIVIIAGMLLMAYFIMEFELSSIVNWVVLLFKSISRAG